VKILVLSPGHPVLAAGGAETAAYALFQHLKLQKSVTQVTFAARSGTSRSTGGGDMHLRPFRGRADELLLDLPTQEHFTFTSQQPAHLRSCLNQLMSVVRPDIVHVHHFLHFGIELFSILHSFGAKIIFTAHEMLTICHHHGQMMKVSGGMCHQSSPAECHGCFPQYSADDFYLRQRVINSFLKPVDVFISPSHFLADRLTAWGGLRGKQVHVIENPLSPDVLNYKPMSEPPGSASLRMSRKTSLGFFGRLTPFKGVVPFLQAIAALEQTDRECIQISLHGGYDGQTPAFVTKFRALLDTLGDCVTLRGAYAFGETCSLMEEHDWIVVPSVWWENSPVVIQEALSLGKPVLCSDIGGMAEKIEDGVSGRKFAAGSANAITKAIARILHDKSSWPKPDQTRIRNENETAIQSLLNIYNNFYKRGILKPEVQH
jgi:glycosyltransferase involved in cell wall biosynthesis